MKSLTLSFGKAIKQIKILRYNFLKLSISIFAHQYVDQDKPFKRKQHEKKI